MASRRIRNESTPEDREAIEVRPRGRPAPVVLSRIEDGDLDRLLTGEDIDPPGLSYDLEACHIGLFADGDDVDALLRRLAPELRCEILVAGTGAVAAWLGSPRPFGEEEIETICAAASGRDGTLALGEPAGGLAGWRSTHRQARAAHNFALRTRRPLARYRDVALVATVAADDALLDFLGQTYLAPLLDPVHRDRDFLIVLRTYLDARCDASTAAAALNLSRETLAARIRLVEQQIGRPLATCLGEVDLALRLGELDLAPADAASAASPHDPSIASR